MKTVRLLMVCFSRRSYERGRERVSKRITVVWTRRVWVWVVLDTLCLVPISSRPKLSPLSPISREKQSASSLENSPFFSRLDPDPFFVHTTITMSSLSLHARRTVREKTVVYYEIDTREHNLNRTQKCHL